MNFKTTLVLVVLLAVVGGYFYFVEYGTISSYDAHQQQQSQQTDKDPGTPVFDDDALTADTINRIRIEHGGQVVEVTKEDSRWFQTQPVRFALESYGPRSVTDRFAGLRYLRTITPNSEGAPTTEQMGLDNPRAVVSVSAGDKTWTLRLGRISLAGKGYAQLKGTDTIYVVDSDLHGAVLDEPVTQWRSKSLNAPGAAGSSSIVLDHTGGDFINLHKIDGRWRFDSKAIRRTSEDTIGELFSAIGRVWINEFIEDNPTSLSLYGLDKPYLRITLTEPAENDTVTTHTLTIGRTDLSGKSRFAAWTRGDEPITVVFTVDAADTEGLVRTNHQLFDPRAVVANPLDVREVVVQQDGQSTLHLLRNPQTGFSFGDPDPGFGADYSACNSLLQRLCALESTRFTTDLQSLGDPVASVRLTLATANGETGFTLYGAGDDLTIVTEGESVGYIVPASDLETLLGPPLGLRDRTALDLTPDQIAAVKLRRGADPELSFLPTDDPSNWRLEGHERFEQKDFEALIGSLNPLRAERWLSEQVTPTAGWITLTLEPVGGAPITIQVDPADGRAVMSGLDSAFVLPASTVRRLNAEYRDRTVLRLTADQIESVTLASNETDVTISRDGQRFVTDTPDGINQTIAAGVFDTLAGLRMQRNVSPLHLRPEDIDFSIQLKTDDGIPRVLRFVGLPGHETTVSLDVVPIDAPLTWFTLTPDDISRLRAPLGEIETPIK